MYGRAHVLKGPTAGGNYKGVCLTDVLPLSIWLTFVKFGKKKDHTDVTEIEAENVLNNTQFVFLTATSNSLLHHAEAVLETNIAF